MLQMADSVTVADLPTGQPAYAAYVDGDFANYGEMVARFPNAAHLPISTRQAFDPQAACLDIESRDAVTADAPAFVEARAGLLCVLYTSASNVDALVALLTAAGIKRSRYKIWSAHYGHGQHICGPTTCGQCQQPDVDGTQWVSLVPYDLSILLDDFFGITSNTKGNDMYAEDAKGNVYRLSQFTPDAGQAPNTPVEQWRRLPATTGAAVKAAGLPVFGADALALWAVHGS